MASKEQGRAKFVPIYSTFRSQKGNVSEFSFAKRRQFRRVFVDCAKLTTLDYCAGYLQRLRWLYELFADVASILKAAGLKRFVLGRVFVGVEGEHPSPGKVLCIYYVVFYLHTMSYHTITISLPDRYHTISLYTTEL